MHVTSSCSSSFLLLLTPSSYSSHRTAVMRGVAHDRGLFVPDTHPAVAPAELESWRSLGYAELATAIISIPVCITVCITVSNLYFLMCSRHISIYIALCIVLCIVLFIAVSIAISSNIVFIRVFVAICIAACIFSMHF